MTSKTLIKQAISVSLIAVATLLHGQALTVPNGTTVAPNLSGSRTQLLPVAAYNANGQCWLVAWSDGDINTQETDLYCSRVNLSGTSLDDSGVCISKASDIQENAAIASAGDEFFVVWQDFRNGQDYDVYGARVSTAGKVLDTAGILIAGGPNNQCFPSIVYNGGQYHVFWQGFTEDSLNKTKMGGFSPRYDYHTGTLPIGYQLYGTIVSTSGVVQPEKRLLSAQSQSSFPGAVAIGSSVIVCFDIGSTKRNVAHAPASLSVDAITGALINAPAAIQSLDAGFIAVSTPPVAYGIGSGLTVTNIPGNVNANNAFRVIKYDDQGRLLSNTDINGGGILGPARRQSVAFDGEKYLVLSDWSVSSAQSVRLQVKGMLLPGNGDTLAGNLSVVSDASITKDQMQGVCAAGPTGSFLLAYAEATGVDNVKIKAKVVTYTSSGSESEYRKTLNGAMRLDVFPNPANRNITISLNGKSSATTISVSIYDLSGRLVKTINAKKPGDYSNIVWDGTDAKSVLLSTGVYVVRCNNGNHEVSRRVLLMR